jgi:type II secretory pathway component GspD/PulD (secretin)
LNSSIEGSNQQRVPFLHRLPVIGKLLFRNQRMSNSYDDLLMFVTPRIIQDEATRQRSLVFESYELNKGSSQEQSAPAPSNP